MKLPTNTFKQAITEGRSQIGFWNSLCSNIVADVVSTVGFDWALIDMEHAPNDMANVLAQLQAYGAGATHPIVRPPWNEPVIIKRLLDMGAYNLLLPMVQTPQEAEAAVRATRYPPAGIRGVSLVQRSNRYGAYEDYAERIDEELCVIVQIETRAALDRAEDIAAVDGVDGVFFGPADLSADMGFFGQPNHPDVRAALIRGLNAVTEKGKPAGILVGNVDIAIDWLNAGFTFVACGSDQNVLLQGARGLLDRMRAAQAGT